MRKRGVKGGPKDFGLSKRRDGVLYYFLFSLILLRIFFGKVDSFSPCSLCVFQFAFLIDLSALE